MPPGGQCSHAQTATKACNGATLLYHRLYHGGWGRVRRSRPSPGDHHHFHHGDHTSDIAGCSLHRLCMLRCMQTQPSVQGVFVQQARQALLPKDTFGYWRGLAAEGGCGLHFWHGPGTRRTGDGLCTGRLLFLRWMLQGLGRQQEVPCLASLGQRR